MQVLLMLSIASSLSKRPAPSVKMAAHHISSQHRHELRAAALQKTSSSSSSSADGSGSSGEEASGQPGLESDSSAPTDAASGGGDSSGGQSQEPSESAEEIYSIVIDAGSTGSRIHIFKFKKDPPEAGGKLHLVKSTFNSLKPGLSSYRDEPQKAADSLRPLIETALGAVPEGRREDTGLSLKATAGLRLLPGSKADEILKVGAWPVREGGIGGEVF